MLVQLDAADALCTFIKQAPISNAEIDVKVVYSPPVSSATIPLEDLLTQPKYIPEAPAAELITNAKLLDFIKTANTLKSQAEQASLFTNNWTEKPAIREARAFIQQVLDETKKEHLADREQRNDRGDPNAMISKLFDEIDSLLSGTAQATNANISIKFAALSSGLKERQAKYNLPFTEKGTFKGALHCEAGLVSILDKTTREHIRARINTLERTNVKKKKKNKHVQHPLLQLLEDSEVGFFSVQLIPTVDPCSIHDNRISRESSG